MKPLSLLVLLCAVAMCYCDDEPVELHVIYESVEPQTNETELARREQQFKDFLRTIAIENKKCSDTHKTYVHLPCQIHGQKFYNKIRTTPLTSENLPYFEKKCKDLDQCMFMFHCQNQREMLEIGRHLYHFCGLEVYSKTEFAKCADKLVTAKSQCYKEWGTYPDIVFTNRGDDEEQEKQTIACRNFFGKNSCLEEDIKSICGKNEWEAFRDHYVDLNPQLMNCSLPYELPIDMPKKPMVFTEDY